MVALAGGVAPTAPLAVGGARPPDRLRAARSGGSALVGFDERGRRAGLDHSPGV